MLPLENNFILKKIKSVKIYHDIIHRIDYSYLAELFRFMGIFVCEEIVVEPHERTEIEKNTEYCAYIYVGKRNIGQEEADCLRCSVEEYEVFLQRMPQETVFLQEYDGCKGDIFSPILPCFEEKNQKGILYKLLTQLLVNAFSSEQEGEALTDQMKKLIDIFVEKKLWFHSMNLQYFSKRKSFAVSEAKEAFLGAHDCVKEVRDLNANKSIRFLYEYALLWCEMKVNSACDYAGEVLYFFIEKLAERCRKLCADYPNFTNAKILQGLIYETSANSANEALWAFGEALKDIEGECFAAPVYYWAGKRYEAYIGNKSDAAKCYQLADRCKPKFRTDFKLASFARDEEDYRKAVELFERIPQKLKKKMQMNFADPLELEYLFKIYAQQCYCYRREEAYREAIRAGENAVNVKKQNIGNNDYFKTLYGKEKEEKYKELLKDRLSLEAVKQMLESCYKKLAENEEA